MQEVIFRRERPSTARQRAGPAPEGAVIHAEDRHHARIAGEIAMEIEDRAAALEVAIASIRARGGALEVGGLPPRTQQRRARGVELVVADEDVEVRHRAQSRIRVGAIQQRDALQRQRADARGLERRDDLAPPRRQHGVPPPGAVVRLAEAGAHAPRHAGGDVGIGLEPRVEQWRDAFFLRQGPQPLPRRTIPHGDALASHEREDEIAVVHEQAGPARKSQGPSGCGSPVRPAARISRAISCGRWNR